MSGLEFSERALQNEYIISIYWASFHLWNFLRSKFPTVGMAGWPLKYIIDHLMYRISLENTTYLDFGRETCIQNNFKDYS